MDTPSVEEGFVVRTTDNGWHEVKEVRHIGGLPYVILWGDEYDPDRLIEVSVYLSTPQKGDIVYTRNGTIEVVNG
jgi:hypothetical protein